jgi:hypothetical protein
MIGPFAWKIYAMLLRRYWYLAKYPEAALLTCDEPVALYTANPNPYRGYGFLNADEVWIPLTPCHLLILCARPVLPEGTIIETDMTTAETVNNVLVYNAYKYVFLHPDFDVLPSQLPADGPLFQVHAPGLKFADRYNRPLGDRRIQRRRPGDVKRAGR